MTVAAQTAYSPYTGNGVTTVFPYAFKILDEEDLTVYVDGDLQTLNVNYSVSGVGDAGGGSITFLTGAPGATLAVSIIRLMVAERSTDYQFQGDFNSDTVNPDFDRPILLLQDVHTQLNRSIRLPPDEVDTVPILPALLDRAGKYIAFDADGQPIALDGTGNDANLRSDLASGVASLVRSAAISYIRTPQEITKGVIPVNTAFVPGHVMRWTSDANVGLGTASASTALANAINSGHRVLGGGPEYTYRIDSVVTPTGDVDIDWQGATFKPNGNTLGIQRDAVAATATTTVTGGATAGSRSVTVTSIAGLAIGQWFAISADDAPTHDASSYPVCWGKIDNIAVLTVTLDRTLPVTYSGTITFAAYATALIFGKFHMKNGVLDGSASTYNAASGQGARVGTFEDVRFENLRLKDWDNNGTATSAIQIYTCLDARITGCNVSGTVSGLAPWDIQGCRSARVEGNKVEGSSFGGNVTRCEFAHVEDNQYMGYYKKEIDNSVSPLRSVRGAKVYGCYDAKVIGNTASDYESGIKVEACFRFSVKGNTVRNCGLGTTSSIALNIGSITVGTNMHSGIVEGNIVENCGGFGLGVSSDTTGKVIIRGNQVRSVQGVGIYANVNNAIIQGNRVEDWGLRNAGDVGIHYSQGATVTGNRFNHGTLAGLACLRSFFQATYVYDFRDNACESANPLGVIFEAKGTATIPNGGTNTGNIAHTLSRTPTAAEITFTPTNNPTTDPGNEWIDTIGATNFVLNCRTNPGASTATFGWRAAIVMPFTA